MVHNHTFEIQAPKEMRFIPGKNEPTGQGPGYLMCLPYYTRPGEISVRGYVRTLEYDALAQQERS